MNDPNIYFIDRRTGAQHKETIYYESVLRFFYGHFIGKIVCNLMAHLSIFSKFFGWVQRHSYTKKKVVPFTVKYGVDVTEFEKNIDQFRSFDDFFTRKLKAHTRPIGLGMIVPADGRYLCYQNIKNCDAFVIKEKKFSLKKLLEDASLAQTFAQGSMVIARLAPSDYHRFHFPVDCTPGPSRLINGPLYSVNPIAIRQNFELLAENKRVITHLRTKDHGTILFIEIGATCVGSIHQTFTPNTFYKKGSEKGYFSFGGSSIILLFEPGCIHLAEDLLNNSEQQIETLCLMGQSLEKTA